MCNLHFCSQALRPEELFQRALCLIAPYSTAWIPLSTNQSPGRCVLKRCQWHGAHLCLPPQAKLGVGTCFCWASECSTHLGQHAQGCPKAKPVNPIPQTKLYPNKHQSLIWCLQSMNTILLLCCFTKREFIILRTFCLFPTLNKHVLWCYLLLKLEIDPSPSWSAVLMRPCGVFFSAAYLLHILQRISALIWLLSASQLATEIRILHCW